MTSRYETTIDDLTALIAELGEPKYRAKQLHEGLFEQRRPLDDLTNIPAALRATLAERLPLALEVVTEQLADRDTTVKWLWRAEMPRSVLRRRHASMTTSVLARGSPMPMNTTFETRCSEACCARRTCSTISPAVR